MSPLCFISNDFYFLNGFESVAELDINTHFISGDCSREITGIISKENVAVVAVDSVYMIDAILKIDQAKNKIIFFIIDTPIVTPCIQHGNWFLISKHLTLKKMMDLILSCHNSAKNRGGAKNIPVKYTQGDRLIFLFISRGCCIHKTSHSLSIPPKSIYKFLEKLRRNLGFCRGNTLNVIKYGRLLL